MSSITDEWRRFGPDSPERAALTALSDLLGLRLRPMAWQPLEGTSIEIEGVDPGHSQLAQVVVNQGVFTSGHRNKVQADLFKLIWLRNTRFPRARVALVLSPTTAAAVKPRSWTAVAAAEMDVDLYLFHNGVVTPLA